jgi:hypothetical protein
MVKTIEIYRGVVPFVALQVAGLALLWMVPSLATYLPDRLFAQDAMPAAAAESAPARSTPAGSPVADDFSDLFDEPPSGRNPPYMDDFGELLPPEGKK